MIEIPPDPPRSPLNLPIAIIWSLVGLSVFLIVGSVAQVLQLGWGLWFSELALFGGVAVMGWQLLGLSSRAAFGMQRFEPKAFGIGVAFGLVNYLAWAVPLMALATAIFPKSIVEMFDSSQIFDRHSPVDLAVVLLGVSIAAPLGEELFFRGVMQRGLEPVLGIPRAIVVTAVIFSAFHFDPVGFMARFELGVLFGLLVWKSGSLWPAIGAHAANNALSSALFFAAGPDAKDEDLVWWVPVVLFTVGNALLYALVQFARGRIEIATPRTEAPRTRPERNIAVPWVVFSVLMIAGVAALDWRGVALNAIDLTAQPSKETKKREEVKDIRARARRGEVPLDDYRAVLTGSGSSSPRSEDPPSPQ